MEDSEHAAVGKDLRRQFVAVYLDMLPHLTGSQLKVYIAITSHARPGNFPWPSRERICRLAGVSLNTYWSSMRRFDELGIITRDQRAGYSNIFVIHDRVLPPGGASKTDAGVASKTDAGTRIKNQCDEVDDDEVDDDEVHPPPAPPGGVDTRILDLSNELIGQLNRRGLSVSKWRKLTGPRKKLLRERAREEGTTPREALEAMRKPIERLDASLLKEWLLDFEVLVRVPKRGNPDHYQRLLEGAYQTGRGGAERSAVDSFEESVREWRKRQEVRRRMEREEAERERRMQRD